MHNETEGRLVCSAPCTVGVDRAWGLELETEATSQFSNEWCDDDIPISASPHSIGTCQSEQ